MPDDPDTAKPVAIRAGTKQAQIIAMLQRPEGATINEIVAETGWLSHTVRAMFSSVLRKKLELQVVSQKQSERGSVYRLKIKTHDSI